MAPMPTVCEGAGESQDSEHRGGNDRPYVGVGAGGGGAGSARQESVLFVTLAIATTTTPLDDVTKLRDPPGSIARPIGKVTASSVVTSPRGEMARLAELS